MELGYDGNAATVAPAENTAPAAATAALVGGKKPKLKHLKRKKQEKAEEPRTQPVRLLPAAVVPKAVIAILVVAVGISAMLMSHAKLVTVNDQAVSLRSELSELQDEATKLKAQYELTYDLQEIETQMLTSGQMIKIQDWQTYTLELAEPDDVEYYHYKGGLGEQVANLAQRIVSGVKAYF